ncbi:transposase [Enterobacter hormaechei]|uniref:transposase n=1 Tax=Enterobacter hormaechei TaxID=158836 RepID=UPI00263B387E|nr:transposase [Enterobacter hormaechei]MDN5006967.1 transposase [Enterobacter hormaechei]MDO1523457.1 transposase [Enterobacter hormaechei]
MKIIKNSVWSVSKTEGLPDALYRVLALYKETGTIVLYELNDNKITRPKLFYIQPFKLGVQERNIVHFNYPIPVWMMATENDIPDKNRIRRDKNFSLISPLLSDPEFLFLYALNERSPLLRNYAKDNNISYSTIKKLLSNCWKYGRGKQSLTPAYARSGGNGVKKTVKSVAVGRKKKGRALIDGRAETYIMRERDSANIKKILKKHYLKPKGKSQAECWRIYLEEYFPQLASETQDCTIPYPSLAQFRYCITKLFSLAEIARRRTTERDFLLNKRALAGSSADSDTLPGSVFEIDATVADVHLVSELTGDVVGRPTVYLVADRATRMITGMHVSYLYASWRAASQALANCFSPKGQYCRLFGVSDISDDRWPCAHVPTKLLCDNAEMLGLKTQSAVVPFTELMFAPSYRADLKGVVESRFRILNQKAIHKLLGTTRGGFVVRGETRPQLRSCYTLKAFTEIMIRAVDEYNHALNTELLYINPLLLEHNLIATPINSWNVSINNFRFGGYQITEHEIISRLLYPDSASITGKGIQYGNRFYECSKDEMVRARSFGQTRVDVRINDNSMDKIYIRSGKDTVFSQRELLSRRKIFQGLPHMEAEVVSDIVDMHKSSNVITPESMALRKLIEANEQEGEILLAALRKKGRGRYKNIRENRRKEVLYAQQGDSRKTSENYKLPPANNIVILPGPEERKAWLTKQNDPYKKDK